MTVVKIEVRAAACCTIGPIDAGYATRPIRAEPCLDDEPGYLLPGQGDGVTGEIELVSDGDGLVVAGERSAVERFLEHAGLLSSAGELELSKLTTVLKASGEAAKTASDIAEQSALYLKLTPESAKRLKDAGGLMKTKTEGISHAMLGDPGKVNKWLQVEDGPASLLTNTSPTV